MPEASSYELITLIKRLYILLWQNIDLALRPYGLARTQYSVLYQLGTKGELPTAELRQRLQVEGATLSGVLDTLAAKGLIERVEQANDKRRKDICLTAAGRQLLKDIPPPAPKIEQAMLTGLDKAAIAQLKASGAAMTTNLETYLHQQI